MMVIVLCIVKESTDIIHVQSVLRDVVFTVNLPRHGKATGFVVEGK